jgi:hypothetical protein
MKTRTLFLTIGILIGLISCAEKKYATYPDSIDSITKSIDSEIIEFKRIGIADTTFANIYGEVFLKSIYKSDTIIRKAVGTNILFRNIESDSLINTVANMKGEYQITIPASEYNLEIFSIGFNKLTIRNVTIGTGEIYNFSAIIGQGNKVTNFKLDSDGLTEKILE